MCSDLGQTLVNMDKFSEAIPLLCDSLAAYDGMGLGPDHPQLGFLPQHCGRALLGVGRPAEAVPLFQRSLAFTERKHGPFHYLIPNDLINLAKVYGQMGRGFGERLSLLDRAVTICELSVGREPNAGWLGGVLKACAECYEEAGLLDEAEERWAKRAVAFEKVKDAKNSSGSGCAFRGFLIPNRAFFPFIISLCDVSPSAQAYGSGDHATVSAFASLSTVREKLAGGRK